MSVRKPATVAVVQMLAVGLLVGLLVGQSAAQPGGEQDRSARTVQPTPSDELALKQGRIASSYARLETLLLRGAQRYERDDPRRAELLKRVLRLSKERLIHLQLENVVKILNQEELRRAVGSQRDVRDDLRVLLELLQSEDRSQKIEQERERVREYIEQLGGIIRRLRDIKGRSEGSGDAARLAGEQGKLADRAGELAKQIQENEEGEAASDKKDQEARDSDKDQESGDEKADGQGKGQDGTQGKDQAKDGQKADAKDGDKPKGDGKGGGKKSGQGKPGGKPGEQPKTQDKNGDDPESDQPGSDDQDKADSNSQGQGQGKGQKKQGQGQGQGQGQNQEQQDPSDQPPQPSYPGRKRIQAAEQKMREAQKKLREAKRDAAIKDQEEARRQLELAKAELEEILRQLREEEIERTLAMLESRFKKMLEMQIKVYDKTKDIYEDAVTGTSGEESIEAPKLSSEQTIRAAKLGSQERAIVFEADKALALLREEGSSVAFPEATAQVRDSMNQVATHLAKADVGLMTQEIEEEIIEALNEMIEALKKAQRDKEKNPRPPGRPPPGEPEDPPLVDALGELRLIRSMQMRVNRRTKRYARLLEDQDDPKGQAIRNELVEALKRLSEHEARIHRVTRDIVLEKNK